MSLIPLCLGLAIRYCLGLSHRIGLRGRSMVSPWRLLYRTSEYDVHFWHNRAPSFCINPALIFMEWPLG